MRRSIFSQWPSHLLAAPLAVVLAIIASRTGWGIWSGLGLTAVYLIALPVARQEYAYYHRSREMLDETVEAVVRALEGADPGARTHGDRVSELAAETGKQLSMSEHELLALRLAARLHDVGILAEIDDQNAEEHHAAVGGRVLARFPEPLIGQFVRAHHERWDGAGAPDGLRGEAIPLGARILAVAEIYDSARAGLPPFDAPMTPQEAARNLTTLQGTALDPDVVDVFLKVAERLDGGQDKI
jgi:HD-GYP domain-containing protein (c-di-GMP phosphodiesterase class II)